MSWSRWPVQPRMIPPHSPLLEFRPPCSSSATSMAATSRTSTWRSMISSMLAPCWPTGSSKARAEHVVAVREGGLNETIITRLAGFVANARYDDLPEEMSEKARLHILDTFGAALAGATSEEAIRTRTTLGQLDGPGQAQLWGTDMQLPPRGAAMVNGIAAHAFELDDTGGCDHSGAVVLPAAMATLPLIDGPVDGRCFITAVALGYDIGRRVMDGFGGYVAHNSAGWHSTGTCGVFAAATAVASMLRLDAKETASCLGLAASFSSGLWGFIHDGAMAKRVHAGRAAEGGLLAALLARQGVTGPHNAFEDVWGGFFKTYAHGPLAPEALTHKLGSDWL